MEDEEEISAPAAIKASAKPRIEEKHAMEGIASDKVNINLGGESGGNGGAMAALVAALGNRNQGDNIPALIAAIGNRGDDRRDDGIAALLPILLLALFGGRGFGRDEKDCGSVERVSPLVQSIMESVADIRAQVPTVSLEIQNAICAALARSDLATQEGFSNVKDAVQNIGALNLSATQGVSKDVATGTLQTILAIGNDGDKTRSLITSFNNENLQRQLTVAQSALAEERMHRHSDGVEVRVNQNVNQQQAQVQQQNQLQGLFDRLERRLYSIEVEQNQIAKNTNANLIIGSTGVATGAQSANPVNVR